jgi:hypothetical protein
MQGRRAGPSHGSYPRRDPSCPAIIPTIVTIRARVSKGFPTRGMDPPVGARPLRGPLRHRRGIREGTDDQIPPHSGDPSTPQDPDHHARPLDHHPRPTPQTPTTPPMRHCRATGVPLQQDHIVNIAAGGLDTIANLQWLCHPCHSLKSEAERGAGIDQARQARGSLSKRYRDHEAHPGRMTP